MHKPFVANPVDLATFVITDSAEFFKGLVRVCVYPHACAHLHMQQHICTYVQLHVNC